MSDRQKPVNYLKKYVGIKEGRSEHKEILKEFNDSKLCTRYTMTTKDAWCATSVSAAFIASGLTSIFPCVECSCEKMIEKAKKAGIWVEKDSYKPSIGDVVMYDWQDSGSGDDKGQADHVGIISSVSGNAIKVIEGNKNDTVGYRDLVVNGTYIRGYITPKYKTETTSTATTSTATTSTATTSTATTSKSSSSRDISKTAKWTGVVTASALNVRIWAGTENSKCSFGPLKKGTKVSVCDSVNAKSGEKWYYICYKEKYGFVDSSCVKKA